MRKALVVVLALQLSVGGFAREVKVTCGSYHENWKEEVALHKRSVQQRKLMRSKSEFLAAGAPVASITVGDIVVMDAGDGVVSRRSEFNLDKRTITFSPAAPLAARYRFAVAAGGYDEPAASGGDRISSFDDDDTRQVPLPFPFPFYGVNHQQVYINSDGNLTFGAGDTATSERSLGRMNSGPPRISPLFRDLDPSQSLFGVRVLSDANRFVVSWLEVPEFSEWGTAPLQTFQVRLFPDGRIEFSYNGISTQSAVIGIAPGGLQGSSKIVSFLEGSTEEFTSTIAERFSNVEAVDVVAAAQKFYETHDDAYDYLVFFNNMGVFALSGAIAYEITLRNDREGYGDDKVDIGKEFGSPRRLQAIMNMGPLKQYPEGPHDLVPGRSGSGDTPVTILAHEAGHLFLAFASVRNPQNPAARPMLGRQLAHWNFFFNSEASVLEGNRICDGCPNSQGRRFTTTATVQGYSPLDQYLMGLRPPHEVPPTFLVEAPSPPFTNSAPQSGVSFDGHRRDIHIDEIIQAEGRRTPDHTVAQSRFRFAFVLITDKQPASPDLAQHVAQVDAYRREFEKFFRQGTSERAVADTTLRRGLTVSTHPAAGVLKDRSTPVTVEVRRPVETALTVHLNVHGSVALSTSSVTIPPGETRATFQMTGVRPGVDELEVRPADSRYDTIFSRIQVSDSASNLRVVALSGDKQRSTPGSQLPEPIRVRVVDHNNLPYAGIAVQAAVTEGGSATPQSVVTDQDGIATFRWTPSAGPLNEFTASAEGAAPAVLTALGLPYTLSQGVVNAASFVPGIAPNSHCTIFGANLAGGAKLDDWPGVRVTLNGVQSTVTYVSERQVNFRTPLNLPAGTVSLVVSSPLGNSDFIPVEVQAFMPGIFHNTSTNEGAVLVDGTGQLTSTRPVARGEFLQVYSTGLGPIQFNSSTQLQHTLETPQVILGQTPAEVLFSGIAPGFPALYQVNIKVPDAVPSGWQPLSLTIGGKQSNTVQVRVQ